MKVRLIRDCSGPKGPLLKGTIIEDRNAFRLVETNPPHAEAADEECEAILRIRGRDKQGQPLQLATSQTVVIEPPQPQPKKERKD